VNTRPSSFGQSSILQDIVRLKLSAFLNLRLCDGQGSILQCVVPLKLSILFLIFVLSLFNILNVPKKINVSKCNKSNSFFKTTLDKLLYLIGGQNFYFGVLHPVARTLSCLLEEPSLATNVQGIYLYLYFAETCSGKIQGGAEKRENLKLMLAAL
jgi:hypothetical protein